MKRIVLALVAIVFSASVEAGSAFTRFVVTGDGEQTMRVLSASADCGKGSCSLRYIDTGAVDEYSLAVGYSRQVITS